MAETLRDEEDFSNEMIIEEEVKISPILFNKEFTLHDEDIDNDMLIEEVKARPAIYNKELKEYSEICKKKKLWEEICSTLFYDTWNFISREQKERAVNKVQKRWTNLRACFSRELRQQSKIKSGQAPSKRRKYFYYHKLLFLQSVVEQRDTSDDAASIEADRKDNIKKIDTTASSVSLQGRSTRRAILAEERRKRNRTNFEVYEEVPTEKSVQKNKESNFSTRGQFEVDPDTNFALSLVPLLKVIPAQNKIDAHIAILNILKEYKSV